MKWFKHDTDANMDAKLQDILLDYGLEGFGLYWYCLELIASKVSKDNITFELEHDARIIARNTGTSVVRIEEMMRKFIALGLFESSNGRITCLKIASRIDKSMVSPSMRVIVDKCHDKYGKSHDPVMIQSEKVMLDKKRTDKKRIEEIKEEEPKAPKVKTFKQWTEGEFIEDVAKYSEYTLHHEDFIRHYVESNGKGKMKFQLCNTWSTGGRLATWAKRNFNGVKSNQQQPTPMTQYQRDLLAIDQKQ